MTKEQYSEVRDILDKHMTAVATASKELDAKLNENVNAEDMTDDDKVALFSYMSLLETFNKIGLQVIANFAHKSFDEEGFKQVLELLAEAVTNKPEPTDKPTDAVDVEPAE